ncbi:MAG: insulinase family protein [Planctomycetes bacterium]|nr:insulinase family protein [Planctomycetota bacterium]MBU4398657.1 insulinase family protein [Planctomycetota bacterium]MCG2685371.1 insulinase family protein [Planctomycetales bacterium]
MEFLKRTLPNGLEIVVERNDEAYSTALGLFVKTGARDENDLIAGASHFLEHMAFKGTPTRSAEDVNREFDEMGAHYNAFTNEENTVYYAAVLPEHQDRAAALLADILRPSLREDDFRTEKQVILEEIRMYDDQPPFGADDKCRALFYGRHPLGRSIIGTTESVSNLSVEALREYCRRRYSPGNIVLAGAGRIDFDRLTALAERCCGDWPTVANGRKATPADVNDGFRSLHKESATQQYLLRLSAGPAAEDGDRFAAKLLATILGDDSGSRLYWELVDPGLAEHASLGHSEHEGAGAMMTYMVCSPEHAAENTRRVLDVYRRAEAEGITADELEQAKSKVRSRIVLGSERPRGRLFAVGSDWVYRRRYRPVELDLEIISGITVAELSAVLAKYPLSRAAEVTIGPLSEVSPTR